jgi:hypothetical protein
LVTFKKQGKSLENMQTDTNRNHRNWADAASVGEFLSFFSKTIAERTKPGDRQQVEEQGNVGYAHARYEGCTGVLICDAEYPMRTAFSVLNKVLDEFISRFPKNRWDTMKVETTSQMYPELKGYLAKFQDPHAADPFLKVQKELDETKVILVRLNGDGLTFCSIKLWRDCSNAVKNWMISLPDPMH